MYCTYMYIHFTSSFYCTSFDIYIQMYVVDVFSVIPIEMGWLRFVVPTAMTWTDAAATVSSFPVETTKRVT